MKPNCTFSMELGLAGCYPTLCMLINHLVGWLQFKFPAAAPTLDSKFPVRRFDFDGRTLSEAGFDLLSSLLTLDPERRATAEEALNHRWCAPLLPASFLPTECA